MTRVNKDTAIGCLVRIAGHFQIPADEDQLARAYITDKEAVDVTTMLMAAKDLTPL